MHIARKSEKPFMQTSPVLSVVIPNYNFGPFLRELLAQLDMLKCRERLEVIVVDGGSKDDSLEVAREFLQPQDSLLYGPDNGQADAISKGLALATGDWFMFQNSDDLFELSALDAFLSAPPSTERFEVAAYDQDILFEDAQQWKRQPAFRHHKVIGWRQLSWAIYYTNQATVYDRRKAQETGFDISKRFAMDYDFVVRYFKIHQPRVLLGHHVLGMQRYHSATKTTTMQDICQAESAEIRVQEFAPLDRAIGLLEAALYHVFKRIAGRRGA